MQDAVVSRELPNRLTYEPPSYTASLSMAPMMFHHRFLHGPAISGCFRHVYSIFILDNISRPDVCVHLAFPQEKSCSATYRLEVCFTVLFFRIQKNSLYIYKLNNATECFNVINQTHSHNQTGKNIFSLYARHTVLSRIPDYVLNGFKMQ